MTDLVFTRIPITGIPELICNVRTDKLGRALDSEGEPLPMDARPFECGEDGQWMLGMQPLCEAHFRETCHMIELDPDDIEAEWRARIRAKQTVGWDITYDVRERDALSYLLGSEREAEGRMQT